MVHLLPLPGSPGARPLSEVSERALRDADVLLAAGFDGLMIENFGDVPFHKDRTEPVTIAAMTRVAAALRQRCGERVELAINVLRNDARGALAVAAAVEASAIRVNVHVGARLCDQGIIEGRADETLRLRRSWGAEQVAIWADVAVKHSTPLGPEPDLGDETRDLVRRGRADVVIVSGVATGASVDPARLARVVAAAGVPVLVGSGVTVDSVASLLQHAHGVIVGTSIKHEADVGAPVDPQRASALSQAARRTG